MSATHPKDESSYFIDVEEGAETTRLMVQDRFITKQMGGTLPEQPDLSYAHDILDIGCGPGGWVLDIAYTYPKINVVGIDISELTTKYARAHAHAQGLDNATFRIMNALKPLDFANDSFDLVNARLICPFMQTGAWPQLLQECFRITRPGGVMRLTEWNEPGITNSPACEELQRRAYRALQLAGYTFAPDGRHFGITQMLGRLLRDAGYQNIKQRPHVIDFSAGTSAHETWLQNLNIGFTLLRPFLFKHQVITPEEFEQLHQQMLIEMMSNSFCGICFWLTVWGNKPMETDAVRSQST